MSVSHTRKKCYGRVGVDVLDGVSNERKVTPCILPEKKLDALSVCHWIILSLPSTVRAKLSYTINGVQNLPVFGRGWVIRVCP